MWETAGLIEEKRFMRLMPLSYTVDSEIMKYIGEDIKDACRQLYSYTYKMRKYFKENKEIFYIDIIPELTNSLNFFAVNLVDFQVDEYGVFLCTQQELTKLLGGYQQYNIKKLSKKNIFFEDRITSLNHLGYQITFDNGVYKIKNIEFPEMFTAMHLLKEAAKEQQHNFGQYMIICLDFRIIAKPSYTQTYEDIILLMYPDHMKSGATELCQYARELKLTPKPYTVDGIHFTYRGKVIASIHRNEFRIRIRSEKDAEDLLNNMSSEQQNFFYTHLKYCGRCDPKHGNGFQFALYGKSLYLCELGLTLRINDFDNEATINNAKAVIKMVKERMNL